MHRWSVVTGQWFDGPFLAVDTETTGTAVDVDRIVTATTVLLTPGCEPVVTSWLINPGVPIPAEATAVHGISDDQAITHGRPPAECVTEIVDALTSAVTDGVPVLAYNASFDLTLLHHETVRHHTPPMSTGMHVLDPFVIDKAVDRYRKGKRTLTAACEHYGVRHGGAHDATADAFAAARVLWAIARRYPRIAAMTVPELHDVQIDWAAEQAASFRQYLIRQGKTEDLPDGQWPMRTGLAVAA